MHHRCVKVATALSIYLHDRGATRGDPLGIAGGFKVARDHAGAQVPAGLETLKRPLQKRRLAAAGRPDQVGHENALLGKQPAIHLRQACVRLKYVVKDLYLHRSLDSLIRAIQLERLHVQLISALQVNLRRAAFRTLEIAHVKRRFFGTLATFESCWNLRNLDGHSFSARAL